MTERKKIPGTSPGMTEITEMTDKKGVSMLFWSEFAEECIAPLLAEVSERKNSMLTTEKDSGSSPE